MISAVGRQGTDICAEVVDIFPIIGDEDEAMLVCIGILGRKIKGMRTHVRAASAITFSRR
jgi:hypothetical protein